MRFSPCFFRDDDDNDAKIQGPGQKETQNVISPAPVWNSTSLPPSLSTPDRSTHFHLFLVRVTLSNWASKVSPLKSLLPSPFFFFFFFPSPAVSP